MRPLNDWEDMYKTVTYKIGTKKYMTQAKLALDIMLLALSGIKCDHIYIIALSTAGECNQHQIMNVLVFVGEHSWSA